jgi:tRNA pseudouridine38-40 synthase
VATFRLILEYDGTDFQGWQNQPAGQPTLQGTLEDSLEALFGERVSTVGSGRTDAGVHAQGQVASFSIDTELDPETIGRALNARLPEALVVKQVERAADDFYALRGARSKCYCYAIWNGRIRSPLRARRFAWEARPLDVAAMQKAGAHLLGEHDFASFQATGSDVKSSVRCLTRLEVQGEGGDEVLIEIEGNGFLRHMVRNIAGTLLEVGRGQRQADSIPELLAFCDRSKAGSTAPACGLTLLWVKY